MSKFLVGLGIIAFIGLVSMTTTKHEYKTNELIELNQHLIKG